MVDQTELIIDSINRLKVKIDNAVDLDDVISLKRKKIELEIELLDIYADKNALESTSDFKTLRDDVNARPTIDRYSTGIIPLDAHLKGGIEVGTFIQLAGESFAGKTHLLLEILSNVAGHSRVMLFNFEMGERRIVDRLDEQLLSTDSELNFLINSKARNLSVIIKEIKNKADEGIKFFGIDSKMKIEVPEEDTDLKAFRKISHELAKLAQQEEIIIILINQMNESDIKESRMSLKGGGDQLYDADIALFYLVSKTDENPNNWKRKLVCRKNRQDEVLFWFNTEINMHGKTIEVKS